jgi:hypothetical protein
VMNLADKKSNLAAAFFFGLGFQVVESVRHNPGFKIFMFLLP